MLADPRHGMEGLALPRGGLIRDQTFVDNTALYLKGYPPNLDKSAKSVRDFLPSLWCKN
jgi:hypothetical protein